MNRKRTYEELERRVEELEREAGARRRADEETAGTGGEAGPGGGSRTADLLRAIEDLRKSQAFLASIADVLPVGIFCADALGNCTYVNERWSELTGCTVEEALHKDWRVAIHPEDPERIVREWSDSVRQNRAFKSECRILRPDGSTLIVLGQAAPKTNQRGEVVGYVGTITDITDSKKAEEALRESEERFRFLAENTGDVLYRLRYDSMTYDYLSPSITKLTEYDPEEIRAFGFSKLVIKIEMPGKGSVPRDLLVENRLHGKAEEYQADYLIRTKSGKLRWLRDHSFPWLDTSGNLVGSVGILTNVMDRKLAEDALQESREFLDKIINSITDPIFVMDREHKLVLVNDAQCLLVGLNRQEVLGRSEHDFYPREEADVFSEKDDLVLETGQENINEETLTDGQGITRTMITKKTLYTDRAQNRFVVGIARDITDRKRAEEKLRESEERFRRMFEKSRTVTLLVDPGSGSLIDANPAACVFYGYGIDEIKRMNISSINTLSGDEIFVEMSRAATESLNQFYFKHRLASGEVRDVEVHSTPIDLHGRKVLYSIIHDITERRRAEEALRESERKFHAVFDQAFQFIGLMKPDGTMIEVNQTALDFAGLEHSDVVGRPFWETMWWTTSEEAQARLKSAISMAAKGEFTRYEADIVGKGNKVATVDFSLKPVRDDLGRVVLIIPEGCDITERKEIEKSLRESERRFRAIFEGALDAILIADNDGRYADANPAACALLGLAREKLIGRSAREFTAPDFDFERGWRNFVEFGKEMGEFRFVRPDGVVREVEYHTTSGFYPKHHLSILRDITARKRTEEELKCYASKLEMANQGLREFAVVASHDFREPLRKILAFGELLQNESADLSEEKGRDYLKRMTSAAKRMETLLDALLSYTRVSTQAEPFEETSLMQAAREAVSDLEHAIASADGHVEIGDLPTIEADATQMRQLFQNLIGNGIKYHRENHKPSVKVYGDVAGNVCQLFVEDKGIGFDTKNLDRMFQPFQRLHSRATYEGTGMGLAICRKIVERHHGVISAESTPGEGSTFIVSLPVRQS